MTEETSYEDMTSKGFLAQLADVIGTTDFSTNRNGAIKMHTAVLMGANKLVKILRNVSLEKIAEQAAKMNQIKSSTTESNQTLSC